ncbi:response regulator [Aeoliella mucimassa]|uniref:Stage 0 sporulation protein A n=1 Tax=Aeoliella mucimassa TaxID=2527972 RepID=A0A518ARI0_9BACT|nr:response regulator [Aeoliella mucimassa]QDU57325.1 Stage 0 sporulation protein A [Aeoliella mucimassa]
MPTPTLLIADDDDDLVELLMIRCQSIGFRVDTANNAMTALGKVEETTPDVVLLDVEMPSGSGLSVAEMMSNHQDLKSIPVIMLTGLQTEDVVRRCHQLCAYYIPKCPQVWSRVEPLLHELFPDLEPANSTKDTMTILPPIELESPLPPKEKTKRASENSDLLDAVFAILAEPDTQETEAGIGSEGDEPEAQPWVLSIEDDDDVVAALRMRLDSVGIELVRACEGREGYRRAFMEAPTAILLDYELPNGNGDYVLRRLKESQATRDIPVITLTGRREGAIERQMRSLGTAAFLTKPFEWSELRRHLSDYLDIPETSHHVPVGAAG